MGTKVHDEIVSVGAVVTGDGEVSSSHLSIWACEYEGMQEPPCLGLAEVCVNVSGSLGCCQCVRVCERGMGVMGMRGVRFHAAVIISLHACVIVLLRNFGACSL